MRNAILQLLYLQMIMLIVDSEYAWHILYLYTTGFAINSLLITEYIPLVNILLR